MNKNLLSLCLLAIVAFSVSLTSCLRAPLRPCDEIIFEDGIVSFNAESLKITQAFYQFDEVEELEVRTFFVNFVPEDCEETYAIEFQLVGELKTTYDLESEAEVTFSNIFFVQRETNVAEIFGFESGTLEIEDRGDGVWNIDLEGMYDGNNLVFFNVLYDFE